MSDAQTEPPITSLCDAWLHIRERREACRKELLDAQERLEKFDKVLDAMDSLFPSLHEPDQSSTPYPGELTRKRVVTEHLRTFLINADGWRTEAQLLERFALLIPPAPVTPKELAEHLLELQERKLITRVGEDVSWCLSGGSMLDNVRAACFADAMASRPSSETTVLEWWDKQRRRKLDPAERASIGIWLVRLCCTGFLMPVDTWYSMPGHEGQVLVLYGMRECKRKAPYYDSLSPAAAVAVKVAIEHINKEGKLVISGSTVREWISQNGFRANMPLESVVTHLKGLQSSGWLEEDMVVRTEDGSATFKLLSSALSRWTGERPPV